MIHLPSLIVRATIWAALALFVVGEAGRRRSRTLQRAVPWALPAFAAGALMCAAHFVAVFHWHHGWSHADAVAATARQMETVFGVPWGGGVWFNYAFLALWASDALAWAHDPPSATRPPSRVAWLRRGGYALMIVNASVVFVPWPTRLAGILLCAGLAWTWRR